MTCPGCPPPRVPLKGTEPLQRTGAHGGRAPGLSQSAGHGHPAAYFVRKQVKSCTFSVGMVVLASQLAYGSCEAYRARKQLKSCTFRIGTEVLPSQLA